MEQPMQQTAEQLWSRGKALWLAAETEEDRLAGSRMMQKAAWQGHPQAQYFLGMRFWVREGKPLDLNPGSPWIRMLWRSACAGDRRAREKLERIFLLRSPQPVMRPGPLRDSQGQPVELDRTEAKLPIKAQLRYENGENVLHLQVNVVFFYTTEPENRAHFEQAVLAGIRDWEGVYPVFGSKLRVQMELTTEKRLGGSVFVMPMAEDVRKDALKVARIFLPKKRKEKAVSMLDHRRSFAVSGLRWTPGSPKLIVIQDSNGTFSREQTIRDVAKHEFGHALGLGDLYASSADGYGGVPFGTHPALDAYSLWNGHYGLVMCDQHGFISGKDLEMVLLAFRDGKMQLYQKVKRKDRISDALM